MQNKTLIFIISIIFIVILFSSCANVKDIAYFQKINSLNESINKEKNSINLYDARLKPKDMLSITIVSSEPEASRIYNLVVPQLSDPGGSNLLYSQPSLQAYMVDNDGSIELPIFGKIRVTGLTTSQLEGVIHKKLESAFTKEIPIVTIRIINYSINVLGEVQNPGKFVSANERLTILEALSLAGDLTIYARRDNIKILREDADGTKRYYSLNLNDKDIIYSPGFYLEQNDVVYVEPNKSRSRSSKFGAAETFGISSLSILLTLTSLILTIFNK